MADRTCIVDGCGNRRVGRGYCRKHYQRWRSHRDPLVILRKERRAEQCEMHECTAEVKARDLCAAHYEAWRRSRTDAARCSQDGCPHPAITRGLCDLHVARERRTGTPDGVGRIGAPRHEFAGYDAAHRRADKQFGRAKTHSCAHCGGAASDWAYDHEDEDRLICADSGLEYSLDPSHYIPLCKSCHRRFDFAWRTERGPGLRSGRTD